MIDLSKTLFNNRILRALVPEGFQSLGNEVTIRQCRGQKRESYE